MLKKLLLAATAAAVFVGPVNAALFTVSGGAAVTPLDSDNNFKTDLEALGFDSLVSGPGLSVSFSDPFAKGFNVYVVGAESGYTNKFFVGGSEFTENNEAFDITRWAGLVYDLTGLGFKANGSGSLNAPGSAGFGVFTKGYEGGTYGAKELFLGFDDQNFAQGDDDNHDDFIVRISAVPEPATWLTMIAGFGLVGYQLRRRGTKTVSAVA